jgi:hypothetical protein
MTNLEFDLFQYVEPDASQSKVRDFKVDLCERDDIIGFVEHWHYSKSINGIISDFCFRLMDNEQMIGAAIYGRLAMANQWKRFGESEADVIELRRLCCVDKTPKNTESFFIAKTLHWLKKHTQIKTVVSYADMEQNHVGTIYKASNFECLGQQAGAKVIMWNGKKYHDKAVRTKYNGQLKPFAVDLQSAIEAGAAVYQPTAGKVAYSYKLR